MARFDFRQGIARRQQDSTGNPSNLMPSNGGSYIDLIVSPDPTVFIISHYDVDYMVSENATVQKAWGPFVSGTDYWCYWDIDFLTGELTRGYTTIEPVFGNVEPSTPSIDEHWFDTSEGVMKVWTGAAWLEKIRLFACKYQGGGTIVHYPLKSQVGLNGTRTFAGKILYDPDGKPLQKFQRNRRGQFITTETPLNSQFNRIANFRIEAAIVQGEAQEHIPIHHAVAFYDHDKLILAKSTDVSRSAIGIAMEDMYTGEIRSYITKGFVTDDINWNWSSYPAQTPLFVGPNGELTPNASISVSQQQIGYIVNSTTIFVDIKPQILLNPPSGNFVPLQINRDTGQYVTSHIGPPWLRLNLDDINDVELTNVQDGDALVYDFASGMWINDPNCCGGGGQPPIGFNKVWGYVHQVTTPDDIWIINHNLGTDKVMVDIYDDTNMKILPNEVTILDANTVIVDLNNAMIGQAFLFLMV